MPLFLSNVNIFHKHDSDYIFYLFLLCRRGDTFDQALHPQGTEIKAITYSNMQIHETPEKADLYVIVDI